MKKALLALLPLTGWLALPASSAPQERQPESKKLLIAGSDSGYVDPSLCGSCHAEIQQTYRHTGMARAFYRLDPENAVGRWCFEHVVGKRPELASKQIFAISGGVTWDAFFLYAGAANALDDLDQLIASGATVIDDKLVLARAVEQLTGRGAP